MAINKVIDRNNQTLIDISQDTVSSDTTKVIEGYTYHGNDGVQYVGTAPAGGGIPGGHNVTFMVDGTEYSVVSVAAGKSVMGFNVTKTGYTFFGWSTTEGALTPNVTFPYTPTADVTFYAVFNTIQQLKATVTGLGSSSPSSVVFDTNANLLGWVPETVTKDGDTFLKFPTFYRKVNTIEDAQITSYTISSWKEDNDFKPYPCFLDENGNLLPYILIGKYKNTSSSSMVSTSSGTPANLTVGNARTYARNRGTGYQQCDWMIFKLWQDLITCKMRTVNINTGSGITTDALGLHWSTDKGYHWIDGLTFSGGKYWNVSYKPSEYSDDDTSKYSGLGYSVSGTSGTEVKSLGYDSTHQFANMFKELTSNSSYNTYYCDAGYFGTSTTNAVLCGVGDTVAGYGAFRLTASGSWTDTRPARLCYRPL